MFFTFFFLLPLFFFVINEIFYSNKSCTDEADRKKDFVIEVCGMEKEGASPSLMAVLFSQQPLSIFNCFRAVYNILKTTDVSRWKQMQTFSLPELD